ncbi:HAD family hydrolase [Loigolactobacillus binensis]|uniref:HAD family hydrolase n=1 Tax=Loigolactobacillus binensis TaxID=2559922 RepID=A0ABW3EEU8_9LACO|nr:HAD family phosphatase [Loigolactobacillus binensis]
MKVQGVIFDMDGLMFDSEKLYYQANLAAAAQMKLPYADDYYERFIGASDEDLVKFFGEAFGGPDQAQEFMQLTYQQIEAAIQRGELEKKPGLDALLAYLDQQQITKIIASSNYKTKISDFLTATQLVDRFPEIIAMDDVAKGKPAPDLFEKARATIGTPAAATLVLEDSRNGLLAAHASGIPCIIVPDLVQPTAETQALALEILPDLFAVRDFIKQNC